MRKVKKNQREKCSRNAHWQRLGFELESQYLEWCRLSGFQASTSKSTEDQRLELAVSLQTGPTWSRISKRVDMIPCPALAVTQENHRAVRGSVLSGNVRYGSHCDKRFIGLCRGIERLRGPDFESTLPCYRSVIEACERSDTRFYEQSRRAARRLPYATCTYGEALALVAMNAESWIRPIADWRPNSGNHLNQFRSLLDHLFVRHTVPSHLFNCWFHADESIAGRELRTFFHLAAGHSIRTVCPDWNYDRRMAHHFMQAPEGLSLHRALRWGQVRAWGGSKKIANAIVMTKLGGLYSPDGFWDSVVRWFTDWESGPWLREPISEGRRNQNYQEVGSA